MREKKKTSKLNFECIILNRYLKRKEKNIIEKRWIYISKKTLD